MTHTESARAEAFPPGTAEPPASDFQHPHAVPLLFGAAFWAVAYELCLILPFLPLKYLPVRHSWAFFPAKGEITMSYFGILMWCVVAFAGGIVLGRRPDVQEKAGHRPMSRLLAMGTLAIYAGVFSHYFLFLYHHWLAR